jgi:16S rRNA (adenine1518-N6/adenine1519-N6)-dimethyltransferase
VYGAVSVKVAFWGTARIVGTVPASVFVPRPNVESALVRIERGPQPDGFTDADRERMFALVRTAFGQRRKMLRRSLAGVVTPEQFDTAQISPAARPEDLGLDAWVALTRATAA